MGTQGNAIQAQRTLHQNARRELVTRKDPGGNEGENSRTNITSYRTRNLLVVRGATTWRSKERQRTLQRPLKSVRPTKPRGGRVRAAITAP